MQGLQRGMPPPHAPQANPFAGGEVSLTDLNTLVKREHVADPSQGVHGGGSLNLENVRHGLLSTHRTRGNETPTQALVMRLSDRRQSSSPEGSTPDAPEVGRVRRIGHALGHSVLTVSGVRRLVRWQKP